MTQATPARGDSPVTNNPFPQANWYGGKVARTVKTYPIYWGAEWSDPSFAQDIIIGLDSFLAGWSGSRYASTVTEYYDKTGPATGVTTAMPSIIDLSAAPASSLSSSARYNAILAKVCSLTKNDPDPNGVYFVFTSTTATGAGGCSWHWGTPSTKCGSGESAKPVKIVHIPYTSGASGTCGQVVNKITDASELGHTQALSAMVHVTAHQFLAFLTNPEGQGHVGKGWFDNKGKSPVQKCFNIFQPNGSYVTFSNGTRWKLHALWSNAAYVAGSGYPNADGDCGCVW